MVLTKPTSRPILFALLQKTVAGRGNPNNLKATKRLTMAFFYACFLSMAGGAWAGFGLAGVLESRFSTPCVVRRLIPRGNGTGGST
ncbi:hypothetical protein [Methylocaldum szegediense]|jgi:hypothetical protein|uniref:hypothetical protein n=1 Tax=Methylocaldum szegediense TaxID=73780 RepID=UPI00295EB11A|nr:hypothetical protein [Methylocaldum szegediense]